MLQGALRGLGAKRGRAAPGANASRVGDMLVRVVRWGCQGVLIRSTLATSSVTLPVERGKLLSVLHLRVETFRDGLCERMRAMPGVSRQPRPMTSTVSTGSGDGIRLAWAT
jgi:hypothetical protein